MKTADYTKFDYSVIQLQSFRKAIAQLISPFAVLAEHRCACIP